MMNKKRIAALVCTGVMVSGMLAGCQTNQQQPIASQGDTTAAQTADRLGAEPLKLTFYYPVNVGGSAAQIIDQICADFTAENPDIIVEPVYTGNYDDTVTKIQTAISGGNPPDVFISLATQRFTMASTGMAIPLDDLIAADGEEGKAYIADFLEGFLEDSYVNGAIYSFSKLQLMLDNSPLEYAEKVFDGTMQEWLDTVDGIGQSRLESYTEQLSKQYPKNIAEDVAREMLMYE